MYSPSIEHLSNMSTGFLYVIIIAVTLSTVFSAVDIPSSIRENADWLKPDFRQNKHIDGGQSGNPSPMISRECFDAMQVFLAGLSQARLWAIQMEDSKGEKIGQQKPPPGTLDGNSHWLGSWEECERVKATNESVFIPGPNPIRYHDWDAKYCRYYFYRSIIRYSAGHCVPETCTESDVAMIVYSNDTGPITSVYCGRENDFGADGDAIAATVILSIFAIIIISATLVDYYMLWWDKKARTEEDDCCNKVEGQQVEGQQLEKSQAYVTDSTEPDISMNSSTVPKTNGIEMGHVYSNAVDIESEETTAATPPAVDVEGKSTQPNQITSLGFNGHAVNGSPPTGTSTTTEANTLGKICLATLLAFSVKRNVSQMVSTAQPSGSYRCMHGVRVFTMLWIILGHTWQLGVYVMPDVDLVAVENRFTLGTVYMGKWQHAIINNMSISVDTFFLLSGALVTISLMKQFSRLKREQSGHLERLKMMGLYYVHRYWRLTPLYAMVLMMYACYFRYFEKGPLWTETFYDAETCKETWWANLLYVNNFGSQQCMGWTWYLANDFQFYDIAPLFAIVMFLFPIYGCIFLFLGYAGQLIGTSFVLTDPNHDWFFDYYIKPWCRFGTYAIGMALGYILYRTKCKVKIPWWGVTLGWILAIVCGVTSVYGSYWIDLIQCEDEATCGWAINLRYAYDVLFRDVFAVCIGWLVFACCTGYGGIANTFLSWKLFVPLSRLTYAGYLVHPIIIYYVIFSRMRLLYLQTTTMALFFCGYVTMTFGAAFLLSLVFEVPMLAMEKVLLPGRRK